MSTKPTAQNRCSSKTSPCAVESLWLTKYYRRHHRPHSRWNRRQHIDNMERSAESNTSGVNQTSTTRRHRREEHTGILYDSPLHTHLTGLMHPVDPTCGRAGPRNASAKTRLAPRRVRPRDGRVHQCRGAIGNGQHERKDRACKAVSVAPRDWRTPKVLA